MNNKGFIITTILYTILVAFLLFLGVTLSIFSSAISTTGSGTNDLVNGTDLSIKQVKHIDDDGKIICNDPWYKADGNILVLITSKYGELYWPRDFVTSIDDDGKISGDNKKGSLVITCSTDNNDISSFESCDNKNINLIKYLMVEDVEKQNSSDTTFGNICK